MQVCRKDTYNVVRIEAIETIPGQTVEAIRKKFKVDVIALRPVDQSSGFKGVSQDQAIAAGDELLVVGPGDRFIELKKVK